MNATDQPRIFAAPPTPFTEQGSLDEDRIPAAIEYALDNRAGIVAIAGTGIQEVTAMDIEERQRAMASAVDAVPDTCPVFAGVSHPAIPKANALVETATSLNVDGLIAFPPWGTGPGPDEVRTYYRAIAAESELPVLLYNNPRLTLDLDAQLIGELAAIDGIEYVKETSRDISKVTALLRDVHHAGLADVFTTMDVAMYTFMLDGAGVIAPPPLTTALAEMRDAVTAGDFERAARLQQRVSSLPDWTPSPYALVKAASRSQGVDLGYPRLPFDPIESSELSRIEAWLDQLGL